MKQFLIAALLAFASLPALASDRCYTVDDIRGMIVSQNGADIAATFKPLSPADYATFAKAVTDAGFQMPDAVTLYAAVEEPGELVVGFDAKGCKNVVWDIPAALWATIF